MVSGEKVWRKSGETKKKTVKINEIKNTGEGKRTNEDQVCDWEGKMQVLRTGAYLPTKVQYHSKEKRLG